MFNYDYRAFTTVIVGVFRSSANKAIIFIFSFSHMKENCNLQLIMHFEFNRFIVLLFSLVVSFFKSEDPMLLEGYRWGTYAPLWLGALFIFLKFENNNPLDAFQLVAFERIQCEGPRVPHLFEGVSFFICFYFSLLSIFWLDDKNAHGLQIWSLD